MKSFGDCYIDLGTANTLIYMKNKGFQIREPTVLTVKKTSIDAKNYFAFGHYAKKMIGKTPLSMTSICPLKEGVISDFDSTLELMNFFLSKCDKKWIFKKSRLIISLPCRVTFHERVSISELGKQLGASSVDLLDEPTAAAIGADLNILGNRAVMIVDIGGGTSEAAILSLGGIVLSNATRVGGMSLDEDIIEHLRNCYRFAIGRQTAEFLKIKVGSAILRSNLITSIEVGGVDLESSLPRRLKVTSEMIYKPIDDFVSQIVTIIRKLFEECSAEIVEDLIENGVVLAGGGALLKGLSQRVSEELGVKVKVADNPLYSVAKGGIKILEDHNFFDRLQFI